LTTNHVLPSGLIRSISGPGDRPGTELLRAGQVSRRLVQLRVILDLVRRDAPDDGRIAGLWDSFAALADVQLKDPVAVAELIGGPQVGAWAAHCLRLLNHSRSADPLWAHLAHLGSIAVVAAVRCGVEIEVLVPVRAGSVAFPTLGRARVNHDEPWGSATCRSGDQLLLDDTPPLEWEPVRLLRTDQLSVPFDDVDPYWSCFGLTISPRVDDAVIERWRDQLDASWEILARHHEDRLDCLASAISCLVPVEQGGQVGGVSASSRDAPGAVAMTEPVRPDRLAATLVHEIQHFRLNALHDLVPLHRVTPGELLYSPWRNDPRGLAGVLHGATAFLGVAEFWSRERPEANRGTGLIYARTVRQLRLGCRILSDSPDLTPAGSALVTELAAAVDRLPEAGLPDDVRRIAADLVAQHRAVWRLRNITPNPVEVGRLAEEWLGGKEFTAPDHPVDRTTTTAPASGDSALFRLAMAWLEDPAAVRAAAVDGTFAARYPGAAIADLPLLAGDYVQAHHTRLAQIVDGAMDADSWASLSIAHARLCGDSTVSLLATHPELVRAAWPHVAGTGQDPLTDLVSRYIVGSSTSDSRRW
jgi:HEXXH motif-containing protein